MAIHEKVELSYFMLAEKNKLDGLSGLALSTSWNGYLVTNTIMWKCVLSSWLTLLF